MKGKHVPVYIVSIDAFPSFLKCYMLFSSNTPWFPWFFPFPPPSPVWRALSTAHVSDNKDDPYIPVHWRKITLSTRQFWLPMVSVHWFCLAWLLTQLKTYGSVGYAWWEEEESKVAPCDLFTRMLLPSIYVCEGWKYGVNASPDTWIR